MTTQKIDLSEKDGHYFTDGRTFNCPFCNRRNLAFIVSDSGDFNWDNKKEAYFFVVRCTEKECNKESFHLSYHRLKVENNNFVFPLKTIDGYRPRGAGLPGNIELLSELIDRDKKPISLDDAFFFHQPTGFFTVDERIPKEVREPLVESNNCRKNNFLTGASACLRKAIYKLLKEQKIQEKDGNRFLSYEERIDLLESKYSSIDGDLFSNLKIIQGLTSQELHENDWDDFDSHTLLFLLETTQEILREIFILPNQKNERRMRILALKGSANRGKTE